MRTLLSRFRQAWKDTAFGVRVALASMLFLGVLLLVLGWIGDDRGFWSDRPFVTNALSSLASAMLGIPIALLVLQQVAAHQAELAEATSNRRLAARVSNDLKDAANRLARASLEGITETQGALLAVRRLTHEAPRDQAVSEEVKQAFYSTLQKWQDSVTPQPQYIKQMASVSMHWDHLNGEIRTRALVLGDSWIDPLTSDRIGRLAGGGEDLGSWREPASRQAERPTPDRRTDPDSENPLAKFTHYLERGIREISDMALLMQLTSEVAEFLKE